MLFLYLHPVIVVMASAGLPVLYPHDNAFVVLTISVTTVSPAASSSFLNDSCRVMTLLFRNRFWVVFVVVAVVVRFMSSLSFFVAIVVVV